MMAQIEPSAHFVLQTQDGKVLREFLLGIDEMTIGRASMREISLPMDKLISRHHATLRYTDGRYMLFDEGSANGTFVNGKLLSRGQSCMLQNGDRVRLGQHLLLFRATAFQSDDLAEQSTLPLISGPLDSDTAKSTSLPSTPLRILSSEQLRFTSFYPQEVAIGSWNSLLVYTHLEQAVEAVYHDAAGFTQEADTQAQKTSGRDGQFLLHGSGLTIIPECKGVTFNPKRVTFQWQEDWHRVEFRFSTKKEWAGLTANGKISIFAGPLLVGTLRLAFLIDEPQMVMQERDADVTAKPYKHIFAAYAQGDEHIGQYLQATYKMLGWHELMNVDVKRSNFDEAVKRAIESAEIFQLFWSSKAAQSACIEQELAYALQLNRGEGFIRPIYWDIPRAPVPEEIANISFTYLPSYTFVSMA